MFVCADAWPSSHCASAAVWMIARPTGPGRASSLGGAAAASHWIRVSLFVSVFLQKVSPSPKLQLLQRFFLQQLSLWWTFFDTFSFLCFLLLPKTKKKLGFFFASDLQTPASTSASLRFELHQLLFCASIAVILTHVAAETKKSCFWLMTNIIAAASQCMKISISRLLASLPRLWLWGWLKRDQAGGGTWAMKERKIPIFFKYPPACIPQ